MNTSELNQEVNIITYFRLHSSTNTAAEYILYNYKNSSTTIYVSSVYHEGDNIKLLKPTQESLNILKKIIQNLISVNPNSFVFSQNKYEYIDMDKLNDKNIVQAEYQKIQLTDSQYQIMLENKYLMYPYSNMTKSKKNKGKKNYNALSDVISIVVSIVFLVLLLGGLIAYHFDFNALKDGVFGIDGIKYYLSTFDLNLNNYLILQVSIVSLLLSAIAYKTENSHLLSMWFWVFLLLVLSFISYALLNNYVSASAGLINFIKESVIYSSIASIIITIPYVLCKEVVSLVTEKLEICNFITYYAIFYILFTISFIGLGLFYNGYLFEYVQTFINKI